MNEDDVMAGEVYIPPKKSKAVEWFAGIMFLILVVEIAVIAHTLGLW